MSLIKRKGFSLIEVLIGILLLSLMLLGFDATEVVALQKARAMYYVATAENQISNMVERLYVLSSDERLADQVLQWNHENKIVLPQGFGSVISEHSHYVIQIFWGKKSRVCHKTNLGQIGCIKKFVARMDSRWLNY